MGDGFDRAASKDKGRVGVWNLSRSSGLAGYA